MKVHRLVQIGALMAAALVAPASAATIASEVAVGDSIIALAHPITATSVGATSIAQEKTDGTFLTVSCSALQAPSRSRTVVESGSQVEVPLRIAKLDFSGCTGYLTTHSITSQSTFHVRRTGGTPSDARADVVPVQVANVHLSGNNLVCRYDVRGAFRGTFDESTQILEIVPSTSIRSYDIVGCGGQLKEGGVFKMTTRLKVASPDGPINFVS